MLNVNWLAKNIGTIDGFLTPAECDAHIAFSESEGYGDAPVSTSRGMIMMKDVRNNERVMIDDEARAAALYERLAPFLPPRFEEKWRPVGLNERLRYYRYDAGQRFDWHHDGYFERENGDRSFFTFMVYLNEGYEGGATSFAGGNATLPHALRVTPEAGKALIFHHPLLHRGDSVLAGRKYVLRSDVMFTRIVRAM